MTKNFHGVLSVTLIGISLLLGALAIGKTDLSTALLYMLVAAICFVVIVYAYCCKCICRDYACGHVLPGRLAAFLPKRKQGPYSMLDILAVLAALLLLVAIPQPWLIKSIPMFVGFWGLFLVAGIEILFFVCTTCKNDRCSLCKNKVGHSPEKPL